MAHAQRAFELGLTQTSNLSLEQVARQLGVAEDTSKTSRKARMRALETAVTKLLDRAQQEQQQQATPPTQRMQAQDTAAAAGSSSWRQQQQAR